MSVNVTGLHSVTLLNRTSLSGDFRDTVWQYSQVLSDRICGSSVGTLAGADSNHTSEGLCRWTTVALLQLTCSHLIRSAVLTTHPKLWCDPPVDEDTHPNVVCRLLEWGDYQESCGLPPARVDDPLFRKTLVTTARMDQTSLCMVTSVDPPDGSWHRVILY